MSAVLGILTRTGAPVQRSEVASMLAAAPHRGPDGNRTRLEGPAAVAYQHFSTEEENTELLFPATDDQGRITMVVDGRIDNLEALAERLGTPSTQVDSILLQAYQRWGCDCVGHLAGDFALIVWDADQQRLFFARDRLGIRDLCFTVVSDRILVASEVRHLLGHRSCRDLEPNETKVAMVLGNCWTDHEQTFIKGIRYCPPGHLGFVNTDGDVRLERYWQPDLDQRLTYTSDPEYAEHFDELFRRAIARRLPKSGNVAVSLSGGPDSAAVASTAVSLTGPERLRTYSYVFDRFPSCDERRYIEQVVAHLGLTSRLLVGDDHGPLVQPDDRIVYDDLGTQDPYIGLVRQVYRAARDDGCRLMFTGHFADILFAGGSYWAGEMASSGRLVELGRSILRHRRHLTLGRPFHKNPVAQVLPTWLRRALARSSSRENRPWMTESFSQRTDLNVFLQKEAGRWDTTLHGRPRRLQHLVNAIESQGTGAARVHFNSMGLEVVDPFFDVDLVEMALAMPADQLGKPHLTKWVLRQSLLGRIPEECRLRSDKTSLIELFRDGLGQRSWSFVTQLLTDPQITRRGWVSGDWLRTELDRAPEDWTHYGLPLWQCVGLEMWLQKRWPG